MLRCEAQAQLACTPRESINALQSPIATKDHAGLKLRAEALHTASHGKVQGSSCCNFAINDSFTSCWGLDTGKGHEPVRAQPMHTDKQLYLGN